MTSNGIPSLSHSTSLFRQKTGAPVKIWGKSFELLLNENYFLVNNRNSVCHAAAGVTRIEKEKELFCQEFSETSKLREVEKPGRVISGSSNQRIL